MSSPPNTITLPKKRPSLSVPSNPQGAKRRKPSTGPSQLRQTSFPPPESSPYAVSPPGSVLGSQAYSPTQSIDGSIAPSTGHGEGGGRGRKRKRGGANNIDDGRSATGVSLRGGQAGSQVDDADAEEEDDGPGDVEVNLEGGKGSDEATQKQEREHLNMLLNNLTDEQRMRYDAYRRVKLKKETVRKITNQTLSQSVPPNVIMTINGYTKTFISDLLDIARTVQEEWARAADPNEIYPEEAYKKIQPAPAQPYNPALSNQVGARLPGAQSEPKRTVRELCGDELGPLLPDHLREALRRYKKSQESAGTGFIGLSLEGKENTAARMGGRRLFR